MRNCVNRSSLTMSDHSPMANGPEEDYDNDNMDYGSQLLDLIDDNDVRTNPKWAEYMTDEEDEIDFRPKIPLEVRARLDEEKEKELIRKFKAREMARIPDDYVPVVQPKPESEEVQAERYRAWCEKLDQYKREKEEYLEENRKLARAEYEKYAKLQKEYRTRDFYWKPDPLFALHMQDLGYSKIAIDKALFYTENKSVARAVEYLKKNPNPTELTKEEVMAVGEEILCKIRPVKPYRHDHTEQILPKEGEMEIEQAGQTFLGDSCDLQGIIITDDSSDGGKEDFKEVPKVDPVNDPKDNDEMVEDTLRRGIKRNYSGEEVKSLLTTSTNMGPPLPPASTKKYAREVKSTPTSTSVGLPLSPVKEIIPEYKMIFLINTSLLMDAITLSLEVGKVIANLTNKMRADEYKNMFDEWVKEGNKMAMYKGQDSNRLNITYKSITGVSLLTHLAECSHYRHVKTPSATVLGIFGEDKELEKLYFNLEML